MEERIIDRKLGIKTVGIREWKNSQVHFNRYEATPYRALKTLKQNYKFNKDDQVVDFGAGRGRVAFYLNNHFHIPVTGIEVNDKTFDEALDNQKRYMLRAKDTSAPIRFEYGYAEHYEIDKKDNCFFFFNPFSVVTFKKVVKNILDSVKENERPIDLILYYPVNEYKRFLRRKTPFTIVNKIRVPGAKDPKEKFIIYRLGDKS